MFMTIFTAFPPQSLVSSTVRIAPVPGVIAEKLELRTGKFLEPGRSDFSVVHRYEETATEDREYNMYYSYNDICRCDSVRHAIMYIYVL
jgi:hypothetical protein